MYTILIIIIIAACFAYFIHFMKTINHIKNMQIIIKSAYQQMKIVDNLDGLSKFVVDVLIYIRKKKNPKYANEVVFQTLGMFTRVGKGANIESDINMITHFANCYYHELNIKEIGNILFDSVIGGMRHKGLI